MATKVNLKKYLPIDGTWQFVPVLKAKGRPQPGTVLIGGQPVKNTKGTFYLEWREDGKRRHKPVGSAIREAMEAWQGHMNALSGESDRDIDVKPVSDVRLSAGPEPVMPRTMSIEAAFEQFLMQVKATKSPGTLDAYKADLAWVKARLHCSSVGAVTRREILDLLSRGREEKRLSQISINRRVLVALMALRDAGATIQLRKNDWPRTTVGPVEIYQQDELKRFFVALKDDPRKWLLFQTYLQSGFRNREIATLDWGSVDFKASTLEVKERPEYSFKPKSYETRKVRIPSALAEELRRHRSTTPGNLVFPTLPHPKRPSYGGDSPDSHHLEMCKEIALEAGLNCGKCQVTYKRQPRKVRARKLRPGGTPISSRVEPGQPVARHLNCAEDPCCKHWKLHKFRHTMATLLLRSGLDLRSLQSLLGHKSLATTEKYLKAIEAEMMEKRIEDSLLAKMMASN